MKKFLIVVCLIVVLVSCRRKEKIEVTNPTIYFTDLITDNPEGIFKNVNFDFTIDDVKATENAQLYEATDDHLFYSYNFPKDTSLFVEYADIKYFFDENKILKIISTTIYLNDSIQETGLLQNFHDYYTEKYGDDKTDDYKYSTWNATAESKSTKGKYYFNIGLKELGNEYGVTLELLRL